MRQSGWTNESIEETTVVNARYNPKGATHHARARPITLDVASSGGMQLLLTVNEARVLMHELRAALVEQSKE